MKFLNMVVCVFLWVALFSGCVSINSSENKEDSISFKNENGILVVSNETGEELILFWEGFVLKRPEDLICVKFRIFQEKAPSLYGL